MSLLIPAIDPMVEGTWKTMSIDVLLKPKKPRTMIDDVESCFWLLLNTAWDHFIDGELPWDWTDLFDEKKAFRSGLGKPLGFEIGGNKNYLFLAKSKSTNSSSQACRSPMFCSSSLISSTDIGDWSTAT